MRILYAGGIALFLLSLLFPLDASAQTVECGAVASPEAIQFMDQHRLERQRYQLDNASRNPYQVPVQFHIVRRSDGTGGLSASQISSELAAVNGFYTPNANMAFYECAPVNFIDDDTYYDFTTGQESALTSQYNVPKVINIYYFNSVGNGSGAQYCGYAYFPGSGRDHIMMARGCANGSTLPHEVGHYFSLYHTHGKTNTGTTDELVTRAVGARNCETAGDELCGTEADPNLSGKVNSSCQYTGTGTDANGDSYTPDPNNIMSYSRKSCRTLFSPDQYARVQYSLLNERTYLRCGPLQIPYDCSTPQSLPYSENFESFTLCSNSPGASCTLSGGWRNVNGDDSDWNTWRGSTPSSSTGPSTDVDPGTSTGQYLYVETSSPIFGGKEVVMTSPCFDLNGYTSADFDFSYHMYGAAQGNFDVYVNDGSGWTIIWSRSGDQGNQWNNATINLDAYTGSNVQLAFYVTTGSSFTSDVAVDAISLTGTGAPNCSNFAVAVNGTDLSCNAAADGTATATPSGGQSPYAYAWSNGGNVASLAGLAAGSYSVTVTDNQGCTATGSVTLSQPNPLVTFIVSVTDESAPGASDGAVDVTVNGGTQPYTYSWSNGATTEDLTNVSGGTYTLTVTDANGCSRSDAATVNTQQPPQGLAFEHGSVNATNGWQIISLQNTYTSPVVVATPVLASTSAQPVVTRVRNASGSSFELRVQNPGGTVSGSVAVEYFVVEEGVYTLANDGVKMEAVRATSTQTAENNNWVTEARSYQQSYTNPVVLGQVMSANDADWSVFWASSVADKNNPYTASDFAAGKHVAEDPDNTRANETIGYVVFETGTGDLGGTPFYAETGADIVLGVDDNPPYTYSFPNIGTPQGVVASTVAMDGGNGGWAVLFGMNPLQNGSVSLVIDEDQVNDAERVHISEQVAFVVFGDNTPAPSLALEQGTVTGVGDSWQTIFLNNSYTEPVIVATPVLANPQTAPVVTRLRSATSTGFDLRIQNPSGATSGTHTVHYVVVEAGTYDAATYGIQLEARRVNSSGLAYKGGWGNSEARSYQQSYTNPVVLGQVMTQNDARWSVFWASNGSQNTPPSATAVHAGRHVGEDSDKTRLDETLGLIVVETGSGTVGGLSYSAGVGADNVRGVDNSTTGFAYPVAGLSAATSAVLSAAGMDGGDGGFPVLFGSNAVTASQLQVAFDEDQIGDSERSHTTEQVAYLVFGNAGAGADLVEPPQTPVLSVEADQPVKMFPNPVRNALSLQFETVESGQVTLTLVDLAGRQVWTSQRDLVEGPQHLRVPVAELAEGVYVVRLHGAGVAFTAQLIKQ